MTYWSFFPPSYSTSKIPGAEGEAAKEALFAKFENTQLLNCVLMASQDAHLALVGADGDRCHGLLLQNELVLSVQTQPGPRQLEKGITWRVSVRMICAGMLPSPKESSGPSKKRKPLSGKNLRGSWRMNRETDKSRVLLARILETARKNE